MFLFVRPLFIILFLVRPRHVKLSKEYSTRFVKYPVESVQHLREIFNKSRGIFNIFNKIICRGANEFAEVIMTFRWKGSRKWD